MARTIGDARHVSEPRAFPRIAWVLCTVARTGSSWLSELAGSTNHLGYPDEYLLDWRQRCGEWGLSPSISLEEFLSILMPRRCSPNGVFAIKGSFEELAPFFGCFPNAPCCWLRRDNKIEQAVSWYRAHHGGLWTRLEDGPSEPPTVPFSLKSILEFHEEIQRRESLWHEFFLTTPSRPLMLYYEDVCLDPLGAVRAIARHVGVDPRDVKEVQSPLRMVRDHVTATWVAEVKRAMEGISPISGTPTPRRGSVRTRTSETRE